MPGLQVRQAQPGDLGAMAALAANHQKNPELHNPYLPMEADAIAADVAELGDWEEMAAVAESKGAVVGWLVGECDTDIGRVWWWGPFAPAEHWAEVADRLYDAAAPLLPEAVSQHEGCGDERSSKIGAWCLGHGMQAETASVLLELHEPVRAEGTARVRLLAEADHSGVQDLHDRYFANTHLTSDALVGDSKRPRLVVEDQDGSLCGYVAVEMQTDGSGYIDYVAVDEQARGKGLGTALVAAACDELFSRGAEFVHLTVRETNAAARALYAGLGFTEGRIARPYRSGFSLD